MMRATWGWMMRTMPKDAWGLSPTGHAVGLVPLPSCLSQNRVGPDEPSGASWWPRERGRTQGHRRV